MTTATLHVHRAQAPTHRPLRLVAALVALVLTLATPGLAFAWADNSFSSADAALLAQLTNQARVSAGLNALKLDATLTNVAEWRSKDMIDRNYFSHTTPDGTKVFDELKRLGYCYVGAGENLGRNDFSDETATQSIQDGFMGSAGHRAVILGSWTVMGVGAYKGADGTHVWTVLFATKCASAPAPTATPTPTPKATPKPTPIPTSKPAATPKPSPAPTAPPATPTARPATSTAPPATPTAAPSPTPEPTAEPAAEITPAPTVAPDERDPNQTLDGSGIPTTLRPVQSPSPSLPAAAGVSVGGLQVIDAPNSGNLIDTIVGDIAGLYFGD
ncbi:MAG: hypothetical protein HYX54_08585 [Chloroflexi bacterium]|nr:hypothetical protein [Chloroflexota bacterium]